MPDIDDLLNDPDFADLEDVLKAQEVEGLIRNLGGTDSYKRVEAKKNEEDQKFYSYEGTTSPKIIGVISDLQWIRTGKWAQVRSSNVAAIMFDKPAMELHVNFIKGPTYVYANITEQLAKDMFQSVSMGKFVHARLKPHGHDRIY